MWVTDTYTFLIRSLEGLADANEASAAAESSTPLSPRRNAPTIDTGDAAETDAGRAEATRRWTAGPNRRQ